jgi:hypothetical protein
MKLPQVRKPASVKQHDPATPAQLHVLDSVARVPFDLVSPLATPHRLPFAQESLARLPLAEAFYLLWRHIASPVVLADLFHRHRGRCYEDKLTFAQLVALFADAITRYHGSGKAAIDTAIGDQHLPTEPRAVYRKFARLPLPLAEAFLSAMTARLRPLFPVDLRRTQLPRCLDRFTVVVLDGKKIKNAAKRLLYTRGRPGKLFGGKILAAYVPANGLVLAMAADPDGEANDIRLMPRVMPLARAAVAGPRLWIADAQFCDLDQPGEFCREEGDHFLVRFTLRNSFERDPVKPEQRGVNHLGQSYSQQWGWMGSASDPRRRYVRRIVIERPGEEGVILVTDLVNEKEYAAEDLSKVYLGRWQIESVFQQITEVFSLEHLIGSTPEATVFQTSLCLVIYNVVEVIRGLAVAANAEVVVEHVKAETAKGRGRGVVDTLSAEQVFRELHEELISVHKTLKVEELLTALAEPVAQQELTARLVVLLKQAWTPRWFKAPKQKPRPHKPKARQSGAHTSVHKLRQQARRQRHKHPKQDPQHQMDQ